MFFISERNIYYNVVRCLFRTSENDEAHRIHERHTITFNLDKHNIRYDEISLRSCSFFLAGKTKKEKKDYIYFLKYNICVII